jgi:phytol kinase
MKQDLINTLLLGTAFLALFGTAEWLYHKQQVRAEFTRKFVHIGTGLLTLLFPLLLGNHWLVLLLCSSFLIILLLSLKYKLLPSINAIDRDSVGSIAYPIAVYGAYLAYDHYGKQYIHFYLPILILAICDPVAALLGKKWPWKPFTIGSAHKTLCGSLGFLISAIVLCLVFAPSINTGMSFMQIGVRVLLIAALATLAEAVSGKGYDNISVPAIVMITLIATEP